MAKRAETQTTYKAKLIKAWAADDPEGQGWIGWYQISSGTSGQATFTSPRSLCGPAHPTSEAARDAALTHAKTVVDDSRD